ncbi:hypothetical protein LCGC14_1525350 [marine sediment metagenome]|uniref:Uncharacterized protein n=1 Tax=marine sediment metagenome TaxID=412755 RepID=A0A0F9LYF1_9ZZZZ
MADADKGKTPEEYAAEYRAWLLECFGTLKVVKSIEALLNESSDEQKLDQRPSLRAAVGLVHPETGEPLIYTICEYEEGYEFNEKAILLTASDSAVEAQWVDEKWILS